MNGVVLVNKQSGFTSFDCVAILRGKLGTKRIGHTGTLDPFATGVLPVMVGSATRLCDILPQTDKRYTATVCLGTSTDTLDITGAVLSTCETAITLPLLKDALVQFKGDIMQIPPMYSAIKVGGQRLYDLARQGIEVERQPRAVTIKLLELLSFNQSLQQFTIDVLCTKGTYIRSLALDIGNALGCGACLTSLVRTEACGYSLDNCTSIEQIKQMDECFNLVNSLQYATSDFYTLTLSTEQARMFKNGVKLDLNRISGLPDDKTALIRVVFDDNILGIAYLDEVLEELRIKCLFN